MHSQTQKVLKKVKHGKQKELLTKVVEQGGTLEKSGGGHLKVYHPNGWGLVTVSATPGDKNAWYKVKANLKQAGFVL